MMRTLKHSLLVLPLFLLTSAAAYADSAETASETAYGNEDPSALGQFPRAEVSAMPANASLQAAQAAQLDAQTPQSDPVQPAPARAGKVASADGSAQQFPKARTQEEEDFAKKFAWWPTDAKPAPVKDPNRSGYWWWPDVPGEARPWGNQGWVYVRKIIFDYKSSDGEMKPSLVIKKVLRNVKIFYDYNKSELREDARQVLDKALYTLEKNQNTDILITGNADQRGSNEYNLKLGERRADTVKQYLLEQGLPEARIRILSRGKLDAMAPTNDLEGMQLDRNAQFMIAEVEEVMIPASKAHLFQDKIVEEKQELQSEVQVDVKEYTIQTGDSLWAIAKREYGDGMQWKRIYEFNKDVISNPDRPKKGTKIRIPIE